MTQFPRHCGLTAGNQAQTNLCEPLARLKREHGVLRQQMDDYARDAAEIGTDREQADWSRELLALNEKVGAFVRELDPHSEREEKFLFPLMAKYIGREAGPIAVMEYEHEQAKMLLSRFMAEAERTDMPVGAARAKEIAANALRAHALLSEHFMKEENVLFPMAENMLSAEEKEELGRAAGGGQ
jgi:iron-sulfur cluster repair protein YtfE (RIC family)